MLGRLWRWLTDPDPAGSAGSQGTATTSAAADMDPATSFAFAQMHPEIARDHGNPHAPAELAADGTLTDSRGSRVGLGCGIGMASDDAFVTGSGIGIGDGIGDGVGGGLGGGLDD